jgi:hypothetical protein
VDTVADRSDSTPAVERVLEAVLRASAADVLEALKPFRLRFDGPNDFSSTDVSLLTSLLGWKDAELRGGLLDSFGESGIPTYALPEIALSLVMRNLELMDGRRAVSLAQTKSVAPLIAHYIRVENALLLLEAGAANVECRVSRSGMVSVELSALTTDHGRYDHLLFYRWLASHYVDDDDTISEFDIYFEAGSFSERYRDVSREIKSAFGFSLEALFWVLRVASYNALTRGGNVVLLPHSGLIEPPPPDSGYDFSSSELDAALAELTIFPTISEESERLTLVSGPAKRLAVVPFIWFSDEYLLTTPMVLVHALRAMFRYVIEGRLPNGEVARKGSILERELNRSRQDWTEKKFERSVRDAIRLNEFACSDIREDIIGRRQIDAVAADPILKVLWVISVKDTFTAHRPRQEMEQLNAYCGEYLAQLESNLEDVSTHLKEVRDILSQVEHGQSLPSDVGDWTVRPLFVTREYPSYLGLRSTSKNMPPVLLRGFIRHWRPGLLPLAYGVGELEESHES